MSTLYHGEYPVDMTPAEALREVRHSAAEQARLHNLVEAQVEAVARAIAEARHGVGVWNEHNMNEVEQNDFRHQARAAIRAKDRHPLCATCNDTGAVGRAPDDYSSCPACNSGSEIAEAEREACIAILEDLRPKNDRSDWTEYAQGRDAVLSRAIAAITARYGA